MSFFDTLGRIGSNVLGGIQTLGSQAAKFTQAIDPISTLVSSISGIFDNKDSGSSAGPFGGGGSAIQSVTAPPLINTTIETGAGPFGGGGSAVQALSGLNNQGSGGSLILRPPFANQDKIIETSQSSVAGFGNILQQAPNIIGLGAQIAKRTAPFFGFGSGQNLKIPQVGDIVDVDQDQLTYNTPRTPMFEEFTQLINPMTPQIQQQGAGFMSPILGRLKLSPRGNLIITRKMRSQFKALADNVGLTQASNLAGIPLEIGAMILTKRFPTRAKSISTKKMRDCARTYRQITNFYNMIPKRSATRTTKRATMRGASTVIQNS